MTARAVLRHEDLVISDALSVKRLSAAIQSNHYLSALEQPAGEPLILPRPNERSFLYNAEVRDVIRRQSIRLARIDAPPRDAANGVKDRRFVREQLAVARRA